MIRAKTLVCSFPPSFCSFFYFFFFLLALNVLNLATNPCLTLRFRYDPILSISVPPNNPLGYLRTLIYTHKQRSYNAAVGAEEWFVLEEVNVLALKSHSTSKSNASSTITTKASGSCSSSRHNADSNSSANSSISSPSCSSGGGHSSNRSSVGVDHDIERNVEGAHEGGVYDADEEFLLAAKMGNKGNENTTSSSDRIEKDKQQQQLKGDYEEEDEEEVVGLWSAVAGPFDAYALATGNGYDAQEAFVQSQVTPRGCCVWVGCRMLLLCA